MHLWQLALHVMVINMHVAETNALLPICSEVALRIKKIIFPLHITVHALHPRNLGEIFVTPHIAVTARHTVLAPRVMFTNSCHL